MSLWSRLRLIFKAKANKALDRAEDPRETLDYSYERQLELLQEVRRGIAEVTTARTRIELRARDLQNKAEQLESQAKMALGQHREDLARDALGLRIGISTELTDLQSQHEQLKAQEATMIDTSRALEERIRSFRTRKETMKATYSSAEARAKVGESAAGISTEVGDLGMAVRRAEDKIAQMQARASALEELMASGALEDLAGRGDRIQSELDTTANKAQVELELMRLKNELGSGPTSAGPHSDVQVARDEPVGKEPGP